MTTKTTQPVQGMSDLGPPEIHIWQEIEQTTRRIMALYGFEEVRTPIAEYTQVFTRSIGDTTDVVQKEMYTFEDRGGRQLSLRPEGTAGVMRYVAGFGPDAAGLRLYYVGPMFRCERPQAGRRRQFHQLGIEAIGAPNPAADVEAIALQQHVFAEIGLKGLTVEVNTRGLPDDRAAVAKGLASALKPHLGALCEDCRRRYETNILRILDCKQQTCGEIVKSLPPVTDFMCDESRRYLDEVLRLLGRLEIAVKVNPLLVRGLDYYVHTVWETRHPALGAQDALSGGGRYRIDLGSAAVEGVGFAAGIERLVTALAHDASGGARRSGHVPIWIVSHGARALEENMVLAQALRMRGVVCGIDLAGRSMKAQMREANKASAGCVVIRGDLEIEKGIVVLKNMKDGAQEELDLPEAIERLVSAGRVEVLKS
jgi:histidyl-tRNA synthetase